MQEQVGESLLVVVGLDESGLLVLPRCFHLDGDADGDDDGSDDGDGDDNDDFGDCNGSFDNGGLHCP